MGKPPPILDYALPKSHRRPNEWRVSRRRWSRLAWASFLLALSPAALGIYAASMPFISTTPGLQAAFTRIVALGLFLLTAYVWGSLSLLTGALAWRLTAREPHLYRGKWLAIIGMVISVLVLLSAIGVHWTIAYQIRRPWPAAAPRPSYYDEEARANRLAQACIDYACDHANRYPDTWDDLKHWYKEDDPTQLDREMGEFIYLGAGLTSTKRGGRPLLMIQKQPHADGSIVLGVAGCDSVYAGRTVTAAELQGYIEADQQLREEHALPSIRELLAPATRPSP